MKLQQQTCIPSQIHRARYLLLNSSEVISSTTKASLHSKHIQITNTYNSIKCRWFQLRHGASRRHQYYESEHTGIYIYTYTYIYIKKNIILPWATFYQKNNQYANTTSLFTQHRTPMKLLPNWEVCSIYDKYKFTLFHHHTSSLHETDR